MDSFTIGTTFNTVSSNAKNKSRKRKTTTKRQPLSLIQSVASSPKVMVGRVDFIKNKRLKTSHDSDRENVSLGLLEIENEIDEKTVGVEKEYEDENKTEENWQVIVKDRDMELREIEKENAMLNETVNSVETEIADLQKMAERISLFEELMVEMFNGETDRDNFVRRAGLVEQLINALYLQREVDSDEITDYAEFLYKLAKYFDLQLEFKSSTDTNNFSVVLSSMNLDPILEKNFEICWAEVINRWSHSKIATNEISNEKKKVLTEENKSSSITWKEVADQRNIQLDEIRDINEKLWDKVVYVNKEKEVLIKATKRATILEEAIREFFAEDGSEEVSVVSQELLEKLVEVLLTDENDSTNDEDYEDFYNELILHAAMIDEYEKNCA